MSSTNPERSAEEPTMGTAPMETQAIPTQEAPAMGTAPMQPQPTMGTAPMGE